MKLEIYQIGKVPPLTIVECDNWEFRYNDIKRLVCYNKTSTGIHVVAEFILDNIAGFKEVD